MNYTKGECGCKVSISGTIYYCPLHKVAPELYEALKFLNELTIQEGWNETETVREALAKAEK